MPVNLTRDEAIRILEEIARDGNNGAARIAAIKQLEEMRGDEPDESGFADLYAIKDRSQAA